MAILLLFSCVSFDARGDDHDGTQEEDLSPGIRLRIQSCGYVPPRGDAGDDDDDDTGDGDDDDTGDTGYDDGGGGEGDGGGGEGGGGDGGG
ncbi:MAG TPA: hypothetical protein DIU15_20780, partial [Deltaproteobacteria bacterium]|nr:hypothetical protein [Deltaproteobacteria bacterium]